MRSKLRRELHEFLEKERISLESGIVNYLVYKLADIAVSDNQHNTGLTVSEGWHKEESIEFSFPSGFRLAQLNKIAQLFNYDIEDYELGQRIVLNDTFVLETVLPKLKAAFNELQETQPQIIQTFRIKSAPLLESSARKTLVQYVSEINTVVMENPLVTLSDDQKKLIDTLMLLAGKVENLDRTPLFYLDILATAKTLQTLKTSLENKVLINKLDTVLRGIDLFARYHRTESVINNLKFKNEIGPFLAELKICSKKTDIVEHTILKMAKIELGAQSKCSFDIGGDKSRFIIRITDFTKNKTAQLISALKNSGDETACEGGGNRQFSSAIAESSLECMMSTNERVLSRGSRRPGAELETYTIEMDGTYLYTKLYPLIQSYIQSMPQELLTPYQEASKSVFAKDEVIADKDAQAKPSQVGVFAVPTILIPEDLMDWSNQLEKHF